MLDREVVGSDFDLEIYSQGLVSGNHYMSWIAETLGTLDPGRRDEPSGRLGVWGCSAPDRACFAC